MVAMDINDTKRKRTLLLHYAGNDVDDIFETRNVGEDYQDKHYFATNKLSEYFAPRVNTAFSSFRNAKQQ